jgi:hypothetical protein
LALASLAIAAQSGAAISGAELSSLLGQQSDSVEMKAFVAKLGTTPEVQKFNDRYYYSFKSQGISLCFDKITNALLTIFLYSEGVDNYRQFQGELPFGLSFKSTPKELEAILGVPYYNSRSAPCGSLGYYYDYKSKGLQITFDCQSQIQHFALDTPTSPSPVPTAPASTNATQTVQMGDQTQFEPKTERKFDPRPGPAKATTESEAVLISKGYVALGTLSMFDSSDLSAKAKHQAVILRKAAEVGGDLVIFLKDEVEPKFTVMVKTGKLKMFCKRYEYDYAGRRLLCKEWGSSPEEKRKTEESVYYAKGSVWRYDPKLAAEIGDRLNKAETAPRVCVPEQLKDPSKDKGEQWSWTDRGDLWSWVKAGQIHAVEACLQSGAPVNGFSTPKYEYKDRIALTVAASSAQVEIAKVLLDHGAEVNAVDKDSTFRTTPIWEALAAKAANAYDVGNGKTTHVLDVNCQAAMVRLLFEHGAIVDFRTDDKYGEMELLSDLLAKGVADINRRDINGWTGLMHAVSRCDQDEVETLLRWGAEKSIKDKEGRTARDLTAKGCKGFDKKRHNTIVELLK